MTAAVFNLREPGEVDPRAVLTGPLSSIRRVRLAPGEECSLVADGREFTLFVLAGAGSVGTGDDGAQLAVRHGVSVTAPLGSVVRLIAGDAGLEFFFAELTVNEDSTGLVTG